MTTTAIIPNLAKPVIGVLPLWDCEKDSVWMLPGYLDGILAAGGIPVVFPTNASREDVRQLLGICSGVLFTGGQDVSPHIYGMSDETGNLHTSLVRDRLEEIVLKIALEQDMPILGICRGLQFINASMGGTLWQDLPGQHPSDICHRQGKPYEQPCHPVKLSGALKELLGEEIIHVNSLHHQAIRELAPGLEAMATAPDGLTEAVRMPGKRFVWAVQWHPEFLFRTDARSAAIFKTFVDACR